MHDYSGYSDPPDRFRFTGEELDGEAGLYYLRARWYDPSVGRFISEDPFAGYIQQPTSLNRYIYVRNNPIRFVDPIGLTSQDSRTQGAINLSTEEFYNEMKTVLGVFILPKAPIQKYNPYSYMFDSKFFNDNRYFFEGMHVYGHELNYYAMGLLYKHYGFTEDYMNDMVALWKMTNYPLSKLGVIERPGATYLPSVNTYLFAHRGYVEYESLRAVVK